MNVRWFSAAVLAAVAAAGCSPAMAGKFGPRERSNVMEYTKPPEGAGPANWEWQFHYVGHGPKWRGYWVSVKPLAASVAPVAADQL
jgi:hypothetical protein